MKQWPQQYSCRVVERPLFLPRVKIGEARAISCPPQNPLVLSALFIVYKYDHKQMKDKGVHGVRLVCRKEGTNVLLTVACVVVRSIGHEELLLLLETLPFALPSFLVAHLCPSNTARQVHPRSSLSFRPQTLTTASPAPLMTNASRSNACSGALRRASLSSDKGGIMVEIAPTVPLCPPSVASHNPVQRFQTLQQW